MNNYCFLIIIIVDPPRATPSPKSSFLPRPQRHFFKNRVLTRENGAYQNGFFVVRPPLGPNLRGDCGSNTGTNLHGFSVIFFVFSAIPPEIRCPNLAFFRDFVFLGVPRVPPGAPPALQFRFSVLPRRLPPGSRLWLGFRAPERANSSCSNHSPSTTVSIFGAPQTSLSICTCVSSMISMSLYAHTHRYTQKPSSR